MAEDSQEDRRPQFGNRLLTDPDNVFQHNAWDNVVWDEEQEREAKQKTDEQLAHRAEKELQEQYEREASEFWNSFYGIHQNRFFKDRHWLFTEFPELSPEFVDTETGTGHESYDLQRKGTSTESESKCSLSIKNKGKLPENTVSDSDKTLVDAEPKRKDGSSDFQAKGTSAEHESKHLLSIKGDDTGLEGKLLQNNISDSDKILEKIEGCDVCNIGEITRG